MILRELIVRDFRRFERFEAKLTPGLNLVIGDNEAGKSTLREAITLALFQDAKTADRKVLAQRRWSAARSFAVQLRFEADGEEYLLTKDFGAKTASLEGVASGLRLEDAKAIEARVKELLGLGSRGLFESTARITQRDVTELGNRGELADSLQRTVTGGEQQTNAYRVLEEIDRALNALKSISRVNPGPLHALPDQIAAKQVTLGQRRGAVAKAERARHDLAEQEDALAAAEEMLALKLRLQRDCAERLRLSDELFKARAEETGLERRAGQVRLLGEGIARGEAELRELRLVLDLRPEEVAEAVFWEQQAAEPLGIPGELTPPEPTPSLRWRVLAAGVALVLVGVVLLWDDVVIGILCLGSGAALIAREWWHSLGRKDRVATLAEAMRREERREASAKTAEMLRDLLERSGCTSAREMRERRAAGEILATRLGEDRARREGLLAGTTVEALEELRRAASKRERDLRERLTEPALRLADMDQAGYQRLLGDIEELERKAGSLRKTMESHRVTVLANQVSLPDIYALEEELGELQERLGAAQERQRVLALARQVLDEARQVTLVSAQDVLAADLSALVAEITAGRYSRAEIDERLGIRLLAPETGRAVAVELEGDLSTGTVEQVYLAARLALARLLSGGRRPPLILDDPFVTYDPTRTAAMLGLCRRLAEEHQVLLFTCREGYDAAADNVVRLPGVGG